MRMNIIDFADMNLCLVLEFTKQALNPFLVRGDIIHRLHLSRLQLLQLERYILQLLCKKLILHFKRLDTFVVFSLKKFDFIDVLGFLLVKLLLEDVDLSLHEVVLLLLLLFATLKTLCLELHFLKLVQQLIVLAFELLLLLFQLHILVQVIELIDIKWLTYLSFELGLNRQLSHVAFLLAF